MNFKRIGMLMLALLLTLLTACGGGSGGGASIAPALPSLSGTTAIGSPIVGGTVDVICASGAALTTTTGMSGDWQITLAGQTLPCAVRVTGGTINGTANTMAYHSIVTSAGIVNVTPLTDLAVANLLGNANLAAWFNGLAAAPTTLATINNAQIQAALTQLRSALNALTPLAGINPITTAFTPTPGNTIDDMLAALQAAIANTPGLTYSMLLGNAAAPNFVPPVGFNAALTTAFAATTTGGAVTCNQPTGTLCTTNAPAYVGNFTPVVPTSTTLSGAGIALTRVLWDEPHIPNVVVEKLEITFHLSGTANPVGTPSSIQYFAADGNAGTALPSTLVNCNQTPAACVGVTHDTLAHTVSFTNFALNGVTFNGTLTYQVPAPAVVPAVTSFTPTSGVAGSTVTITGTNLNNFTNATPGPWVSFGNVAALSTLVDNQTVTAIVPAGLAAGNTTITLSNGNGSNPITVGTFNVQLPPPAPPAVTGYSPVSGSTGMTVTITGTNLNGYAPAPLVKFGTTVATSTLVDNQTVTATVPGGLASGNHTITISNGNGTSPTTVGTFSFTLSVSTLAGSGVRGTLDGTGAAATFNGPGGLVATGGNVYVADGYVIRKVEIATGIVTTYAGAINAFQPVDGVGTAASFSPIRYLATDGTNLYVSEFANVIRKIAIATGTVTTLAGTPNNLGGYADGTGAAAAFNGPSEMTYLNGNLYVTDLYNNVIRKIVVATGTVSTFAGTAGNLGYADGVGASAVFNQPLGITHDATSLYVTDASNGLIRQLDVATATVTTLAGTYPPTGVIVDGVGLLAQFGVLNGVQYEANCQCLYVVDRHAVRKLDIGTKAVTTIAGSSALNGWGGVDGAANVARFNQPKSISGDGTSLFLTDFGNYKIRRIQ